MAFDYDYIVIGSGFGGAVSALRLTEKGYRVGVLEMGRRWRDDDFPTSNLNVFKYLWMPKLLMRGFFQITWLRDVVVFHGAGVGGGSLVYANTLLEPPDAAFRDPRWPSDEDWRAKMRPFYDTARFMLGAVEAKNTYAADELLRQVVDDDLGAGSTFEKHTVGVYFGDAPGAETPDPFFGGAGPARTTCIECGACMSGCRHNAKNTLDKNYLYLAEKGGCTIHPETRVTDIRPVPGGGYEVHTVKSTAFVRKRPRVFRAKGVVVSASVLGTVKLLMQCKERGSLPQLSDRLGDYVRTNSEAILAARARHPHTDFSRGIAITSGVHPDEHTHIEIVRYGKGHNFSSLLFTILTGGGPPWPRQLRWLGQILRHPIEFLRTCRIGGWAERTAIVLVMQPVSNWMRLRMRDRPWGRRLDSELEASQKVPTYMPLANDVTARLAGKMDGTPESMLLEVVGDTSSTAHILGGATMGRTPEEGVCDPHGRVWGYDELYIADGSIVPANLGVNPSLTITALSEYVMSTVPPKEGAAAVTHIGVPRPAAEPV